MLTGLGFPLKRQIGLYGHGGALTAEHVSQHYHEKLGFERLTDWVAETGSVGWAGRGHLVKEPTKLPEIKEVMI